MDVMKANDGTVTHVPCENAFHRACLEEWANTNFSNHTSPTCPKCRANVAVPRMRSVEASLGDPPTALPLPLPPFGERSLATVQSQMYDFDMRDAARHGVGFPTPAYFHCFNTHRRRWVEWLSDYFVRLSQAQVLDQLQAVTRVVDCYMLMSRADVEDGILTLRNELQEGEWATDLQIIEPTGERRPRPSVVNFSQAEPRVALDWLAIACFAPSGSWLLISTRSIRSKRHTWRAYAERSECDECLDMLEPRPVSQEGLSSRDREAGSWPREVLYKKGKSSPWVIIKILQAGVSPGDSA
jgi:hypothetical protein